jgi:peptide/nickel transport system ATP-binding protein
MTALRVDNISKCFDLTPRGLGRLLPGHKPTLLRAVDDVSFAVGHGQTFSLVGESGCGKSTVARLVVGLHRPDAGHVTFAGTELTALRSRREKRRHGRFLQMIFQDPYASLNPRWRVFDIIAEPIRVLGLPSREGGLKARVDSLLVQVGLSARDATKYPHEFSGGQRQRISIARALASEPKFLVCDEPTSALDVSVQAQILNLLSDLQTNLGLSYLFISHNLAVVSYLSHTVGVMYLGRLVEVAPAAALFAHPRHPYTRLLLDTIPDLDMTGRQRRPVAGEVPNPIDPPQGCAFHPRCPHARERCRVERPPVALAGETQVACHGVAEGWIPDVPRDVPPLAALASRSDQRGREQ